MGQQAHATYHDVAERIGKEYVESDSLPNELTQLAGHVYRQIGDISVELEAQIPVPVIYQESDPYDSYADMAETVAQEQQIRIYNQHTEHPFFSHEQQLAFRAVHDWFGHLSADVNFSPEGEYKKYCHMKQYFNPIQNRVMFAEVVGQVGAVHYLDNGFASDRYKQRAFLAPNRWLRWMDNAV